jgi:hypothetical protein
MRKKERKKERKNNNNNNNKKRSKHNMSPKLRLGDITTTPNCIVYGELGRCFEYFLAMSA